MKISLCLILALLIIMCFPHAILAQSDIKPIQIAIWHPVQLYDSTASIQGIRFNLLYGVNKDIHGIDWGLVQKLNGNMKGWQNGCVNLIEGNMEGFQQGVVNQVKGNFSGLQYGAVNINMKQTVGVLAGFYNSTNHMRGIQVGFVNITETLHGLQIGLVNINNSGDPFKFLPIINYSF